jgi:hypothetical protein
LGEFLPEENQPIQPVAVKSYNFTSTNQPAHKGHGPAKGTKYLTQAIKRLVNRPGNYAAIARKAVELAKAGNPKILSIVLDRCDGPVRTEISGPDGESLFSGLQVTFNVIPNATPPKVKE